MTDLFDRDLARLAHYAPPDALNDLEHRIAAAIAVAPVEGDGLSGRGMVVAGVAALLLGVAGGGLVAGRGEVRERPRTVVAALDTGLAPSDLLLGR